MGANLIVRERMAMRPNQQLRPKIQEGATVCTKAGVRDCVAKTEKTNGCDWGRVTGRVCVCVCVHLKLVANRFTVTATFCPTGSGTVRKWGRK